MAHFICKPITYNGKKFKSLKEFAAEYNINYSTVRDKVSKGKSIDDIVHPSKTYRTKPIVDPLTNITYPSTKAFCRSYNIDPSNYRRLLNKGHTLEEICKSRLNGYIISSGPITDPFGNKFRSKTEMCTFHNKTYKQVYSRLAKGKTLKEALTESTCETTKFTSKPITYNGKTYKSISDLCREFNLNPGTVRSKLYRGVPIEIIVETLINPLSKRLPKHFKKIKIAYTHNNIDYYECVHNNQKYILSISEMKALSKKKEV